MNRTTKYKTSNYFFARKSISFTTKYNLLYTKDIKHFTKQINKLKEYLRISSLQEKWNNIFCPLCIRSEYIYLRKQINQKKFVFRCKECDLTFYITIKEHEHLCPDCNGSGMRRDFLKHKSRKKCRVQNLGTCRSCKGNGKLDWCARVTLAKGMR